MVTFSPSCKRQHQSACNAAPYAAPSLTLSVTTSVSNMSAMICRHTLDLAPPPLVTNCARNVLPPPLGLGPSASRANLRRFPSHPPQPPQTVIHPQRHPFHRSPREMPGLERLLVDAEPHTRPIRHIRRPLALKIRQYQQAVRTGRHPR